MAKKTRQSSSNGQSEKSMRSREEPPPFRYLRAYAFDPTLGMQLETAVLNEVTLRVRWEKDLATGPIG